MSAAFLLLAALFFRSCLWAEENKAPPPTFSTDSIVNSANGSAASLAPNTLASIYGSNLSYSIASVSLDQVGAGKLPATLGGVSVTVAGVFAALLYVSPSQVNFVIPNLLSGEADVSLVREAVAGPKARINLIDAAPALFVIDSGRVAATHADGTVISPDAPARRGEIIVLYGTGMGVTNPRQVDGVIPRSAARIVLMDGLRVLLDGELQPIESVTYAGITPGYPGLYQINLRVPEKIVRETPEVRIVLGDQISQSGVALPVEPPGQP